MLLTKFCKKFKRLVLNLCCRLASAALVVRCPTANEPIGRSCWVSCLLWLFSLHEQCVLIFLQELIGSSRSCAFLYVFLPLLPVFDVESALLLLAAAVKS